MRERYLLGGAESLMSHELLELLLFHALPQINTNPIAHALLARFGSLEGVFSATKEELLSIDGIGEKTAAFLLENGRCAALLASAPWWENQSVCYDDYRSLGAHFVSYFSERDSQATVAMLLNAKMNPILTMEVAALDFGSAGVRSAPIITRAVALGASIVVLAHNHLHGSAHPTHADVVSLGLIDKELSDCGVFLLEHFIVSGKSFVGFHKRFPPDLALGDAVRKFLTSKEATTTV